MKTHLTRHSTMRHILLPLLTVSALASYADAASGVRVQRLGEPPLLPRHLDTKPTSHYKRPTLPENLAKPTPKPVAEPVTVTPPPATAPEAPAVRGRRLPLAPDRPAAKPPVAEAPKPAVAPAPAPAQRIQRRLPAAPAPAPAPAPKVIPAPAPKAAPAPAPAPQPAAPRPRRRLPIAPVAVADGSTDLPPVPSALIRR